MRTITRLYALGSNGSGQLGIGHDEDTSKPVQCVTCSSGISTKSSSTTNDTFDLTNDEKIVKLVAGGNHTLLLTTSGVVYAAGNIGGQHSRSDIFRPVSETRGKRITDIAATWEASFFVQDDKRISVLGRGDKAELGLGVDVVDVQSLTELPIPDLQTHENVTIKSISTGMNHVVIRLSDQRLIGWGSCRKGQLGNPQVEDGKVRWTPQSILVDGQVARAKAVATGRDFTLLVDETGTARIIGDQKQFKMTPKLHHPSPDDGDPDGCQSIQSSWSSIFQLHRESLYGFGRNDRGQLPTDDFPTISSYAAGSEHVVALTKEGDVISWGWGEHGNCGEPVDEKCNVAGRYNKLEIELKALQPRKSQERVVGVAAGCATTFIWTTEEKEEEEEEEEEEEKEQKLT